MVLRRNDQPQFAYPIGHGSIVREDGRRGTDAYNRIE
jgi:hypothetical protein